MSTKYIPAQDRKYADLKKVEQLIVHCSDSDVPAHDNPEVIDSWHLKRGWTGIGYHYFITKAGFIYECRPVWAMGSHCLGQNHNSLGICLSGRDEFTKKQHEVLVQFLKNLLDAFDLKEKNIKGHYEYDPDKTCPNFVMGKIREEVYVLQKRKR